jgi:exodeoxyribonuclease V alpha subunit
MAEILLKDCENPTLPHGVLLAFIHAASRAGYLKVDLTDIPAVWEENVLLMQHIHEGSKTLPSIPSIVQIGSTYYLQKNYTLEQTCLNEWARLNTAEPLHPINISEIESLTTLTNEQKQAVMIGCNSLVFILTGGPGTGKTYTAGRLLHQLQKCTNAPLQIALAAPTGKAALTLEKSLGAHFQGTAKTLHALLGMRGDGSFPERITTLPYDVILVDESSMIDIELMTRLLSTIKTGAKLFLMGDPYQLPPVDGAPIFPALAKNHPNKIELTKCLRAETLELVQFAEAIRQKQPIAPNTSVEFLDPQLKLEDVLAAHLNRFPTHAEMPPEELLIAFQKFRILTPLKLGPQGTVAINQWIAKHLQNTNAIPLLITSNDYRLQLFNGEIGVLIKKDNYVHFASGKKLPAPLLPAYELAYAMTVHKSQGSEFDEVLLLLPESKVPISSPLLYTAATRARKKLTLYGTIPNFSSS